MALNWKSEYSRYRHYLPAGLGSLYKKKSTRAYTGLTLTLFTISFFLFFAVKPTVTTITRLLKTITDQKTVSSSLQQKIASLARAQDEYNLISTNLPLLVEAIPEEAQADRLAQYLETTAYLAGVDLTGMNFESIPLWGETVAGERELNFKIQATGDYANLKDFLGRCLGLRRIIQVQSFGFRVSKGTESGEVAEGENTVLTLNIGGKAFYLPDKE